MQPLPFTRLSLSDLLSLLPVALIGLPSKPSFAGTALSYPLVRSYRSTSLATVNPPQSWYRRSFIRPLLPKPKPYLIPDQPIPRCTPQRVLSLMPRTIDHEHTQEGDTLANWSPFTYRDAARSSRIVLAAETRSGRVSLRFPTLTPHRG